MRAVVVRRFGDSDVLTVEDVADPTPGPGEVSIDVTHAAVGLIDVYIRQGLFKDRDGVPQPPYTPGLEVAGTIRALGDDVNGFRVGEPVVTLSGGGSQGYASINLADALLTISLDGSKVDPALAVSAIPNAATAHLALTRVAHLESGESVLIHGALGGLASAFPAMAHQLGASRVVGTVLARDFEAASGSSLPFDQIVEAEQFPAAVSAERFDVVVDPVGGALRTASLDAMSQLGRLLAVGNASGDWEHSVGTNTLWQRNLAVLGFSVGFYLPAHKAQGRSAGEAALQAIEDGLINIDVEELPLDQAPEAHSLLESGRLTGRIVLRI